MSLQLEEYLPNLGDTPAAGDGRPVLLAIDLIDEDPLQPRSEFEAESLGELARTIAARGVLQPGRHDRDAQHIRKNRARRRARSTGVESGELK